MFNGQNQVERHEMEEYNKKVDGNDLLWYYLLEVIA